MKWTALVVLSSMIAFSIALPTAQASGYESWKETIIKDTNYERASMGVAQLKVSERLTEAAQKRAEYLAKTGQFDHLAGGSNSKVDVQKTGYNSKYWGENLAIFAKTPEVVVPAWINSPGHRKNLRNPKFNDVGIGIAQGEYQGKDTVFIVQIFGQELVKIASTNIATTSTISVATSSTSSSVAKSDDAEPTKKLAELKAMVDSLTKQLAARKR